MLSKIVVTHFILENKLSVYNFVCKVHIHVPEMFKLMCSNKTRLLSAFYLKFIKNKKSEQSYFKRYCSSEYN